MGVKEKLAGLVKNAQAAYGKDFVNILEHFLRTSSLGSHGRFEQSTDICKVVTHILWCFFPDSVHEVFVYIFRSCNSGNAVRMTSLVFQI